MAWKLHTRSHNTWWTWKTKQDNRTDHQIKRYWRILCNHQTLFLWKEVINEGSLGPVCLEDIQEFLSRGYLKSPNVVPQLDSQMLNISLNLVYLEVFLKKCGCWEFLMLGSGHVQLAFEIQRLVARILKTNLVKVKVLGFWTWDCPWAFGMTLGGQHFWEKSKSSPVRIVANKYALIKAF